ncbi:hypothetical protein GCM10010922_05210 [Microbacterium sorbitolivorans]|uniref:Pr6Pr family membrane protein n=1 Tax=Microbacterium sorbitolivorans TaxID=1867410 RepID=A0A367Y6R4_9MICO|nr:Pr6Pr family membrane protein [Microbacterium sorbitolivorans]RCK61339.1 hypothetical protein DTO57_01420 [Microbacterium sorbitolivorans]GGF33069.1 hypothetical protein GCM10010922_05210 [Microbacterium sorbitolivorans]
MPSATAAGSRFLTLWSIVRAVAAIAAAVGVIYLLLHDLAYVRTNPTASGSHVPTYVANFFSYFTIESNIFVAVYLTLASIWGFTRGRRGLPQPIALASFQILAACCILLTGVVYNVLLRGEDRSGGIAPFVDWTNELMHVVIPLVMLADVIVSPRPRRVPWGTIFLPVGYAIAYLAYTIVRAPFIISPVGGAPYWYPYPFLNPHVQGGWGGVMIYVVVMSGGFALFAALLIAFMRWRASRGGAQR